MFTQVFGEVPVKVMAALLVATLLALQGTDIGTDKKTAPSYRAEYCGQGSTKILRVVRQSRFRLL
jgi:hypothetical protein